MQEPAEEIESSSVQAKARDYKGNTCKIISMHFSSVLTPTNVIKISYNFFTEKRKLER